MSNNPNQHRLESIDALRGFDMFFIMGGSFLVVAIAGMLGDTPLAQFLTDQMGHAEWDGFRHHDTIFPLFLFISGTTFPFSYSRQIEKNASRKQIILKVIKRGAILVLLGLFYNGLLKMQWHELRFCSVLSRIGIAWMIGALIFMKVKTTAKCLWIAFAILIGYGIISFIPAPDIANANPFSKEGALACYIDRIVLGAHCYRVGIYDPEGLLSTIPAISTALLGITAGNWIKTDYKNISPSQKALILIASGIILALLAWIGNFIIPINKALWSSTFVCAAGAYSLILLGIFYYIIDVKGWKRWDSFFTIIGLNSITIYMVQRFVPMYDIRTKIFGGIINLLPEYIQQLGIELAFIFTCWFLLYFLHRHKIYLKV